MKCFRRGFLILSLNLCPLIYKTESFMAKPLLSKFTFPYKSLTTRRNIRWNYSNNDKVMFALCKVECWLFCSFRYDIDIAVIHSQRYRLNSHKKKLICHLTLPYNLLPFCNLRLPEIKITSKTEAPPFSREVHVVSRFNGFYHKIYPGILVIPQMNQVIKTILGF